MLTRRATGPHNSRRLEPAETGDASPSHPHSSPGNTNTSSATPRDMMSSPPPDRRGSSSSSLGVAGADGEDKPVAVEDMAARPSEVDQQFVMLRNTLRGKILEYIGRKQSSAEQRRRLPKLAKQLEEILYRKFPNRNEYYNMMKEPIEPHLQYAIKTLIAQNQQNQQNLQMAGDTASSSATMTPDENHGDPCEKSASLPADVQNNADELGRTE